MKASMAARLEGVHGEAMAKSNFSFSQQLELKEMELSKGNEEVYMPSAKSRGRRACGPWRLLRGTRSDGPLCCALRRRL